MAVKDVPRKVGAIFFGLLFIQTLYSLLTGGPYTALEGLLFFLVLAGCGKAFFWLRGSSA